MCVAAVPEYLSTIQQEPTFVPHDSCCNELISKIAAIVCATFLFLVSLFHSFCSSAPGNLHEHQTVTTFNEIAPSSCWTVFGKVDAVAVHKKLQKPLAHYYLMAPEIHAPSLGGVCFGESMVFAKEYFHTKTLTHSAQLFKNGATLDATEIQMYYDSIVGITLKIDPKLKHFFEAMLRPDYITCDSYRQQLRNAIRNSNLSEHHKSLLHQADSFLSIPSKQEIRHALLANHPLHTLTKTQFAEIAYMEALYYVTKRNLHGNFAYMSDAKQALIEHLGMNSQKPYDIPIPIRQLISDIEKGPQGIYMVSVADHILNIVKNNEGLHIFDPNYGLMHDVTLEDILVMLDSYAEGSTISYLFISE